MRLIRQVITQKESTMFTVDMLIEKKACASQLRLFRCTFPNGAPLTVETAISVSHLFDWEFAAQHFLSKEGYKAYQTAEAPHLKAYDDAEAPLLKVYEDAEAPHLKGYQAAEAPLWKDYQDAIAPLWKDYEDARAPHLKVYEDARAQVFAELYIKESTQ